MTEPAPVVLVIDDEIQIRRFLRAGLELDETVPEHSRVARLNVWPSKAANSASTREDS